MQRYRKRLLMDILIAVVFLLDGVFLYVYLARPQPDRDAHKNSHTASRASYLMNCATSVCRSKASIPGSVDELKKWMTEEGCRNCKEFGDCFVDGYGVPFAISLERTKAGEYCIVVRSAGKNKLFDETDLTWTQDLN